MAYGRKTGGRNFKKGVVTNPKGRPRVPEEVKIARDLTQNEFILMLNKIRVMTSSELKRFIKDKDVPVFQKALAKILHRAELTGDYGAMEALLNRMLGKVAQKVQFQKIEPFVIEKLDEETGKPVIEVGVKQVEGGEDGSSSE